MKALHSPELAAVMHVRARWRHLMSPDGTLPLVENVAVHGSATRQTTVSPVIAVTHLTKDYHLASYVVHALRAVSLEVHKGEFVAIMGPSGKASPRS